MGFKDTAELRNMACARAEQLGGHDFGYTRDGAWRDVRDVFVVVLEKIP